MSNRKYTNLDKKDEKSIGEQDKYNKVVDTSEVTPTSQVPNTKDDSYYFNMINEETGRRYDIPMLNRLDPGYYYDYIRHMKMKEQSPETFEKILNWD